MSIKDQIITKLIELRGTKFTEFDREITIDFRLEDRINSIELRIEEENHSPIYRHLRGVLEFVRGYDAIFFAHYTYTDMKWNKTIGAKFEIVLPSLFKNNPQFTKREIIGAYFRHLWASIKGVKTHTLVSYENYKEVNRTEYKHQLTTDESIDKIKEAINDKEKLISVLESLSKQKKIEVKKMDWVGDHGYYHGNLIGVDTKNDWRFCEVKGKRKEAEIIGLCKPIFPVKYPILINGCKLWKP